MSNGLEAIIDRGLGLTQQDVAKLGPFGVVREAVRLLGGLHPSLVWILFTLALPYSLYLIIYQHVKELIVNVLHPDAFKWDDFANLDVEKGLWILLLAFLIVLSFCLSLVILAAVYFAVGSIYNGRNVAFSQVLHAVPRLWGRLFVTAVVNMLLFLSVGVVYGIFMVIFKFTVPGTLLPNLSATFAALSLIPLFIINLMFQVANGVTCFEEHYGMTAFRKGKHIMHNKWGEAVVLFFLLAIPTVLVEFLLESPVKLNHEFHWIWLVLTFFYIIISSYLTELICIAWAVFYFSCAANYEQHASVPEPDLPEGYRLIGESLA